MNKKNDPLDALLLQAREEQDEEALKVSHGAIMRLQATLKEQEKECYTLFFYRSLLKTCSLSLGFIIGIGWITYLSLDTAPDFTVSIEYWLLFGI